MIVPLAGLLFAAVVCAFSLLVAGKAQQGLRSTRYQSLIQYGKETQAAQDKSDLHRFGLPQLFRRTNGGFAAAGMSMNAMGMVGGAALLFGPALASGGPTAISIGLPFVALLSICVSASLAEQSSGVPTAGGVYHAAYQLGGRKWGIRAGWLQTVGYLSKLALFTGGFAVIADGLLSSRLGYETTALTFIAAAAIGALTQASASHYGAGMAGKLQAGGIWLQLFVVCAVLAGLVWLFWPGDYSPVVVYEWLDGSLESPVRPLMLTMGILLLAGLFTGMDGAAHGAEETVEPRVRVPWAIFLSTSYTYIGLFVLLFFMTLVILPSNSLPIVSSDMFRTEGLGAFVQHAAAAWGGSYILPLFVLASLWLSGYQTMTACSRVVFSMARDEALPFSSRLARYSVRRRLPLMAVWFVAVAALALLVSVGLLQPSGAFLPLVSAAIVALHLACAIPIGLGLLADIDARKAIHGQRKSAAVSSRKQSPPWHLGNWSFPIRGAALAWLLISAVMTAGIVHPFGGIAAAGATLAVTAIAAFKLERKPAPHGGPVVKTIRQAKEQQKEAKEKIR
ncbi:MAG: amino acid permease-associated region [Paenibacillus sp.]|nr:amino acid permease-associated region [Paenibacillus sp.]